MICKYQEQFGNTWGDIASWNHICQLSRYRPNRGGIRRKSAISGTWKKTLLEAQLQLSFYVTLITVLITTEIIHLIMMDEKRTREKPQNH